MRRWFLAIAGFAVLFFGPPALCQGPLPGLYESWRWRWFGVESGLPAASIDRIIETPSGELWTLTRAGMAWYNGSYWQSPPLSPELPSLQHTGVLADSSGVYLYTQQDLYRVDHAGYHRIPLVQGSSRILPRRVVPIRDLGLLVQGDSSLYLLRHGRLEHFPSPFDDPATNRSAETTYGPYASRTGFPFLNATGGLYRWSGVRWDILLPLPDEYMTVIGISDDSAGNGTACGRIGRSLTRIEWSAEGEVTRTPLTPAEVTLTSDCDDRGMVMTVTQSGDVAIRTQRTWRWLDPLPSHLIGATTVRFDSHGDLWVGKSNGIYVCRLSSGVWTRLVVPGHGPVNTVNALLLAADSTLWVGTSDGVLVYRNHTRVRSIQSIGSQRLGIVTGLAQDRSGHIWITSGASFGGVYRWDGSTWKHFGAANGFSDNGVHRIVHDREGRLWFLTISFYSPGLYPELEDGAFIYDGTRFERVDRRNGLPDGRVYAMVEDSAGTRWFATGKGIGRMRDDVWTYWTSDQGLRSNKVFTLALDRTGRLWFGHQTQGLGYLDENGAPAYLTPEQGFASPGVWDLLVDHAGRLWVGTREGLAVHDRGQWSTIGLREGLPSPNIWPLLLHDDVLYIGMSNAGVAELNLRHLEGRAPWIRFNDPVDRGDMITLAWQAYGTPGTPFGGDIPTRYRLDDDAWSAWGKTAMLELRNVAVGEHTITVQARGPLAQVDPAGTSLRFTVPPPFYLRPLFLLSVGALTGLFLFLGYITLLRRAQHSRELRERDARYRVMAEATGQLIYDLDVRTGKISWQGAVQAVTGYTKEEFSGADLDRWRTLLHPDDREHVEAVFRMALSNRSSVQMEFRLRKKDGEFVDLFANGFVLQSPAHEPERVLGTLTDISARKQGEMQIAASLKEKEVLLKEIHHRVKNNLQVISSLLSLQSGASADNHAREQLRESQNRIRSMALIHERLYQSENLAQVDLGEYVQSLIAYLFRSYSVPNVRVIYSIDRCSLPVNTAIPCGLMINELVSNALKYAFKGRPEGEIEIGFSLLEGNRGVLMVRDDGVGFPPGLDHRATPTLGLQLVNTLTSQINGTLELVPGRGTTFTITLPLEE